MWRWRRDPGELCSKDVFNAATISSSSESSRSCSSSTCVVFLLICGLSADSVRRSVSCKVRKASFSLSGRAPSSACMSFSAASSSSELSSSSPATLAFNAAQAMHSIGCLSSHRVALFLGFGRLLK